MIRPWARVPSCLLLIALGLAPPARAADAPADLARQARLVLKQNCFRCHHGEGSQGGEFDVLKPADLLSKEFWDPSLVVAGKPDDSYLLKRVSDNEMPPRNIKERPSDSDKAALKAWIAAGVPASPDDAVKRPFITITAVLKAARDYLRDAEPENRASIRFFTLHTMANYNPAVVKDDDLRLARAALSKAINSLSRKPAIVVPIAVDPAKTLYAVDIRSLGWDRSHGWEAIERAYPYGLKYDSQPDEALKRLDRDLGELSLCDLPIVRADWFVATATRPPLYHTLLQLPDNTAALEHELGVDIAGNFRDPKPDRIARAGFVKSGVSGQNRMVERNEAAHGSYYWPSYDFKAANGRAKLTRFPLGPLNLFPEGQHPFASQAFNHDGGEIIFGLENGLQAYLLVNGQGKRIDAGPIEVVSDPLTTSGTNEIVTGLSCMACHKNGMIEFTDSVRASSAVFGEAEQVVRRLYPEKPEMDRLLKQDGDRFMAALEKAIGPFIRDSADKNDRTRPLREFPEPVAEVARFYRLNYLDLKAVACELDVEDPQVIVRQVGETKLKRLGLDGLLKGGFLSRPEWEATDGTSLMQDLARELRFSPLIVR